MSILTLHGLKVHGFKNTMELIIWNIQLRVHNGKLMLKDTIQRSRQWGHSSSRRTYPADAKARHSDQASENPGEES